MSKRTEQATEDRSSMKPGLHRMAEAAYHADPCPVPSLSRSIAELLIMKSARHAWTAHPRLNPKWEPSDDNSRAADIGTAAHARLLRQPTRIVVIEAQNYQTKAAKEQRAEAYASGAIPLLEPDAEIVDAMLARADAELAGNDNPAIGAIVHGSADDGSTMNEIVAAWQDRIGGRWCRARIDRLTLAPKKITIIDYKTTEMSAAPGDVQRAIFNNTYHLQDGFYRRGIRHLFPEVDRHEVALDMLFIVQEQKPPHEITVARISPAGRVIGEKMASAGLRLWNHAMETGEWPGYPTQTVEADMPAWIETNWLAREIEDPRFEGLPFDPLPIYEATPYRPMELAGPC